MKRESLLILLMLLLMQIAYGQNIECDGIAYNILNGHEVEVTSLPNGKKYSGYLNIPDSITVGGIDVFLYSNTEELKRQGSPVQKYCVRKVGDSAFKDCVDLVGLYLPAAVTEIGREAMSGCINLLEITMPQQLSRIGDKALKDSQFRSITFTGSLEKIGDQVFYGANAGYIMFNDSKVRSLGKETFTNSTVKRVFLPPMLESIPENTFRNCKCLKYVALGNTLEEIGPNAFKGCGELKSLSMPASLKKIGKNAFLGVKINSILFTAPEPPIYSLKSIIGKQIPTLIVFPPEGQAAYHKWCPEMFKGKSLLSVENGYCKWACPEIFSDSRDIFEALPEGIFTGDRKSTCILLSEGKDITLIFPNFYGGAYGYTVNGKRVRYEDLPLCQPGQDLLVNKIGDSGFIQLEKVIGDYIIRR